MFRDGGVGPKIDRLHCAEKQRAFSPCPTNHSVAFRCRERAPSHYIKRKDTYSPSGCFANVRETQAFRQQKNCDESAIMWNTPMRMVVHVIKAFRCSSPSPFPMSKWPHFLESVSGSYWRTDRSHIASSLLRDQGGYRIEDRWLVILRLVDAC